jgi:hypothetical protein
MEKFETIETWHSSHSSISEKRFSKPLKEGIKDLEFQLKNINDIINFLNRSSDTRTKKKY